MLLLLAGGLGDLNYPLVADLKKEISEKYGVLTGEQQQQGGPQHICEDGSGWCVTAGRPALLLVVV